MASLAALASAGGSRGGDGGPPSKKARMEESKPQVVGMPFGQCLFQVLLHMSEEALKVATTSGGGLEIEIRVGMIVQNGKRLKAQITAQEPKVLVFEGGPGMRFVPGVDEPFLEDMKKALIEKGFKGTALPPQRIVCDKKGNRMEVEAHGPIGAGKAIVERKELIYRKDLALLSHGYDIRMDAAFERPLAGSMSKEDVASISADEKSFTQIRLKKRTQYKLEGSSPASLWKIDITEVEVTHCAAKGNANVFTRELEVELELEEHTSTKWLRMEETQRQEYTREILNGLMHILHICVPCDTLAFANAANAAGASLSELRSTAVDNLVQPMTMRIKDALNAAHTHSSFVGTMPVNLSRRSLVSVQKNNYYIAEKTDGVRYLLYVIEQPGTGHPMAVLMDRKGALFTLTGSKTLGSALGVNTVLDGELVYNRSLQKMVFLLFDVLLLDGRENVTKPFGARNDIIGTTVMSRYIAYFDDATKKVPGEDKSLATPLIRKIFYKREQLPALVGKLRTEDGERVFFDSQRRHWKSDGLVFQPDRPYVMAADQHLLKWKWPELRSVDLQARVTRDDKTDKIVVSLWAMGPDGVYIDCTANGTSLAMFDQYRLLGDMAEHPVHRNGGGKPPVVEVVYDTNYGVWCYHTIRGDKKEPNAIHTVMGVLMELAESIPIEELEYCFGASELLTDFPRQLTKMKKQLLDWQKKRK